MTVRICTWTATAIALVLSCLTRFITCPANPIPTARSFLSRRIAWGLRLRSSVPDGRHLMLRDFGGANRFMKKGIRDLSGDYLSDYNTQRIEVDMGGRRACRIRDCAFAVQRFSGVQESAVGQCFWMGKIFVRLFGSFQRWSTGDARVSPLSKSRSGHDR